MGRDNRTLVIPNVCGLLDFSARICIHITLRNLNQICKLSERFAFNLQTDDESVAGIKMAMLIRHIRHQKSGKGIEGL